MGGWEYLEAYVYQDDWIDSSGRRVSLKSETKMHNANTHFTASPILNELGTQGWELVGIVFQDMSLYRLFLKRQRPELRPTERPRPVSQAVAPAPAQRIQAAAPQQATARSA